MVGAALRRLLANPTTRGLDLDDPATTVLRRDIIRRKPFLRAVYQDWYRTLAAAIPTSGGMVVELGSGPGFVRETIPECITSEMFVGPPVALVANAETLPFRSGALRAIVMTNVFHHINAPYRFLEDAARAVRVDGIVAMIEPWVTPWSTFVYRRLHHEPFVVSAAATVTGGPLSGANGALPWIVFARDRHALTRLAPAWTVETVHPMMPFRYLVSGGVSMRSLTPGWTTALWRRLETALEPSMDRWAMFALIVLRRRAG